VVRYQERAVEMSLRNKEALSGLFNLIWGKGRGKTGERHAYGDSPSQREDIGRIRKKILKFTAS